MEEYFPPPLSPRMRVSGKIQSGSQDYKWRSSLFLSLTALAAFLPVESDWSVTLQWAWPMHARQPCWRTAACGE